MQYKDGNISIVISGDEGAKYDLSDEKHIYNPVNINDAIIQTASRKEHVITHNAKGELTIENVGAFRREGNLIGATVTNPHIDLPPIEFGKPWEIPGVLNTSGIKSIRLKYKIGAQGALGARPAQEPNPFDEYSKLVSELKQKTPSKP